MDRVAEAKLQAAVEGVRQQTLETKLIAVVSPLGQEYYEAALVGVASGPMQEVLDGWLIGVVREGADETPLPPNNPPAPPTVTIVEKTYNSLLVCGDDYYDPDNVGGADPHTGTKYHVIDPFTGDIIVEGELGPQECLPLLEGLPPNLGDIVVCIAYQDTNGPIYGNYGCSEPFCLPGLPADAPVGLAPGPKWITVSANCDDYIVRWSPVVDAVAYQVWVAFDGGTNFSLVGEITGGELKFLWEKPDHDGMIQFKVRAFIGGVFTQFTEAPAIETSFHESDWCLDPSCGCGGLVTEIPPSVEIPDLDDCIVLEPPYVPDVPPAPQLTLSQVGTTANLTILPGG